MKTVAEIAKELQVTPQAVYKRLNQFNNRFKTHIHKGLKGEKLLDAEGESILKEMFKPVETTDSTTVNQQFINSLLEQLKVKDQQLQEKDEQIRQLIQINQTNQMVLLQAQKQLAAAEEKSVTLYNAFTETDVPAAPKKGFWAKIFKRHI